MNKDLLECKKRAKELVASETPPCNENGRKKGYIEVMKQLWDERGYDHLRIRSQNLRDQASRLEKMEYSSMEKSQDDLSGLNYERDDRNKEMHQRTLYGFSQQEPELINSSNISQNANSSFTLLNQDLHMTKSTQQIPGDDHDQTAERPPGCIPEFFSTSKPNTIKWGKRSDGSEICLENSVITNAYNEIATWRKNVFLVLYGRTGRVDQVTSHINDWNNKTNCQHISLKAAFVLLAVGLQKPSPKSKAKEHQELLSKRLEKWKDGEIDKLLREGRIIQSRIGKLRSADPPDKSKVFTKLVLKGQINSALRFLSENTSGGVLQLTDEVMEQLQQKHPDPQPAKLGSLLFGPIDTCL